MDSLTPVGPGRSALPARTLAPAQEPVTGDGGERASDGATLAAQSGYASPAAMDNDVWAGLVDAAAEGTPTDPNSRESASPNDAIKDLPL